MKNKMNLTYIIVIIVVGFGAFFGGIKYDKYATQKTFTNLANMTPQRRQAQMAQFGQNGNRVIGGNRFGGGGNIDGTIISKDNGSITIKGSDGSSKIANISGSTTINKQDKATANDLAVNQKITVNGQLNSDGTITAQMIRIQNN